MQVLVNFMNDENGAVAIEYGLIASLIAIATISAVRSIGSKLSGTFARISGNLA